jgi:hypothetical protein
MDAMRWTGRPIERPLAAGRRRRGPAALALAGCLLALLAAGAARAQEPAPPAGSAVEAPSPPAEERSGPKIIIHGFLTQAYARADSGQILGIPEKGTADYRAAALQVRADLTDNDIFAIQLQHERFGDSVVQGFHSDVELDWLFYEHRWGDSAVKIGKVQIPFGIYNEVRDVGTLLPFYRPSPNFYGEGAFTSETVDGIVLSHTFNLGRSWQLDGDLHYGNWEYINRSSTFEKRKVRNSTGVELWLSTPVPGLRVGAGAMRYDVDPPDGLRWETYHVSMEAEFGRFVTHAEYKNIDFGQGTYDAGYAHLGFRATDKITINAQLDRSNLNIDFFRDGKFDTDKALGVNYAFRNDLVLKAEYHWNEGYTPEVPQQDFFAPAVKTNYGILSLSTSF